MTTIVVTSGGFDPVHSGHIRLLKAARLLGDQLIVGINSDEWLARKKGRAFLPWQERLCVLNNLSCVDEVYTFDDEDGNEIWREDYNEYQIKQIMDLQGDWYNEEKFFLTDKTPSKWVIWAHSKSQEWAERIEGLINYGN
jgi:cytidyltransferase-like protein